MCMKTQNAEIRMQNEADRGHARVRSAVCVHRSGFTLTEILIVIALIVLIIALAVPAFGLITGTRSVDAGENLVSAMLSRARAIAINNNQTVGVVFFRDLKLDRSAMAIVVPASQRGSVGTDPPGLEQYKAWKEFEEGSNSARVHYVPGDVVCCLIPPRTGTNASDKPVTQLFVCIEDHNASALTKPPKNPPWGDLEASE